MARKAVEQEELKRAKDGLDVWDDIRRYAAAGDYGSIPADDLERFKWFGIYRQKPNDGHFMVRIKIPGGRLTAMQLREIGAFCRLRARNIGDVTTRQDIQLHWLTIRDMPELLDCVYDRLGMYQEFSCGDAPRNTTSCPLAGELADEIVDAGPFARAIADMYRAGGKQFSNLPRKFKTAVGACPSHCHEPQMNCAALFGVRRKRSGGPEAGFGLLVGGGLRDTPHFAQSLRVFLKPDLDLVRDVFCRIAEIFRDQESLRQGRLRARLKFYVAEIGWQAFRDRLEERLGYRLEHDDDIVGPENPSHDDHMGITALKNGLRSVGVPIPRGRLSGDQMVALADLAGRYCRHPQRQINTTIKQNLILLNIDPADVPELCARLADIGLPTDPHPLRSQLLSCTGTQFCNLAVVETKDRAARILEYLEAHVPMDAPLFVSVTGCPNSCAQYQLADIGLQGVLYVWRGVKGVEHYHVLVGARMGPDPVFSDFICRDGRKVKVPAELIHLSIERLIRAWQAERRNGEPFGDWARRQEANRLAGLVEPAEEPQA